MFSYLYINKQKQSNMKTKLFKMAWAIVANFNSFAEALKAAWKAIKLSSKMKSSVVSFSFKKIDGSIRKAIGTLKDVPATLGVREPNHSVLTYFDVEANAWRSAKIENLLF